MRRTVATILVLGVLSLTVAAPQAAWAGGRHRGGHHGYHHSHGNSGAYFAGGLAFGAFTGLVLGSLFLPRPVYVAPAPVYAAPAPVYQPAPVYAAPAPVYVPPTYVTPGPTVCTDAWVEGYWAGGAWIPAHWQRVCR